MNIIIGNGTVGRALAKADPGARVVGREDLHAEKDDVVFLAFGKVNIDWCSAHPLKAWGSNVGAPLKVIDQCWRVGAKPVFISSCQVFGGEIGGYEEHDKSKPLNEYGRQKKQVEDFLKAHSEPWVIARCGSMIADNLGTHCIVEKTYKSLLAGNARMSTDDAMNVTPLADVAKAMLGLDAGIYHLVSEGWTWRARVALEIVQASTRGLTFSHVLHDDLNFAEPRPRLSYMVNRRLSALPGYADALARKVALLDAQ